MVKCPSCGENATDNGQYCNNCGEELGISPTEQVKYCSQCGQQISAEDRYCGRCGFDTYTKTKDYKINGNIPSESTRRKILKYGGGGLAVMIGAGIIGSFILGQSEPTHTLVGEGAWENYYQEGAITEGTLTLNEGEYAVQYYYVNFQADFRINVNVVQGGALDVLVIDEEDLEIYQEGDDFTYYTSLSETISDSRTLTGSLGDGDYAIIFDNTAMYKPEPSGNVIAEIRIE